MINVLLFICILGFNSKFRVNSPNFYLITEEKEYPK